MKTAFTFKTRLTLWYLLIVTVLLAFWGLFAYLLLSNGLKQQNMNPPNIRIDYIDNQGNIVSINMSLAAPSPQDELLLSYGFAVQKYEGGDNKDPYFTLITPDRPVKVNQGYITGNLSEGTFAWVYLYRVNGTPGVYRLMTMSQPGTGRLLSAFANALLISLPAAILLAGLLGVFLLKTMMRPLDHVVKTAEEITGKNLSRRLNISGNDELGRLGATMDLMFERLEKAFIREKQFTGDISHELGTPLSVINGEAELALQNKKSVEEYRQTLGTILDRTRHLSSITRKLLFLARDESNQSTLTEDINLTDLLLEIGQDAEVLGESKNISFNFNPTCTALVKGVTGRSKPATRGRVKTSHFGWAI